MPQPLYDLPPDDAPLSAWLRPLSATYTPTRMLDLAQMKKAEAEEDAPLAVNQRYGPRERRRGQNITPLLVGRMVTLRGDGKTVPEIAAELGISERSVNRAFRRLRGVKD